MEPNILNGPLVPSVLFSNISTPLNKYITKVGQEQLSSVCLIDALTNEQHTVGSVLTQSLILAAELQALGCKPGNIVGIICENRIEYPVMMLSVVHTGATLSCFNPSYSIHELEHTMSVIQPYVMFADTKCIEKLHRVKEKSKKLKYIIQLDGSESSSLILSYAELLGRNEKRKFVQPEISVDNTSLILFSSGSTGLPKGVMLSNYSLVFLLDMIRLGAMMQKEEDSPKILALSVIPMFHGYGFLTVLRAIVSGETIVFMNKFHPEKFLSAIEQHKVTRLLLVPALVVFLVKHPMVQKYDLSSVTEITCGAAPLSVDIEKEAHKKFNLDKFVKGYGMTETTIVCTLSVLSDQDKHGSVGKVAPGMIAKVADLETGEPLGPNKEGEICFKGVYLMQGYYNNEKETKSTIDEDGWLHTGDVGYYDEDEDIFLVDRIKDLIKYKGYQVAPAELEAIILKHDAVKDVAVIGIPDDIAGELPRAFVVKARDITEKQIIEHVAAEVAPHMKLRGGVIFIDEIPRNAGGKILRKDLRNWVKPKL